MKPQMFLALLVAVVCSAAAGFGTLRLLSKSNTDDQGNMVDVLVANTDIEGGTVLSDAFFDQVQRPKEYVPEGALSKFEEVENRALRFQLTAGELVTEKKLAPKDVHGGLEPIIREGMRAMTVKMSTDRAAAGFIKPHSHVDIILIRRNGANSMSRTILQDVEVIAVNQVMRRQGTEESQGSTVEMVTFLMTPEESEKLALAQQVGELSLVLRSNIDKRLVKSTGYNEQMLAADNGQTMGSVARSEAPVSIFDPGAGDEGTTSSSPDLWAGMLKNLIGKGDAETSAPSDENENAQEVADLETPSIAPPIAPVLAKVMEAQPAEAPTAKSETVAVAPKEAPKPAVPLPTDDYRQLVIRDEQGNPLMTVVLDADSNFVRNLGSLIENADPEVLKQVLGTEVAPEVKASEQPEG